AAVRLEGAEPNDRPRHPLSRGRQRRGPQRGDTLMQAQTAVVSAPSLTGRRVLAVLSGVALVALAAQIALPLPGTPVPLTLPPLAVPPVGGPARRRLAPRVSRARRRRHAGLHPVRSARRRPTVRPYRRIPARLPDRRLRGRGTRRGRAAVDPAHARRARRSRAHPPRRAGAAAGYHPQPAGRRSPRHAAVSRRRPGEAGDGGSGPATRGQSPARAPMTARVSF